MSSSETIYAFLGTNATTPTTFLAAISNNANDYNGPSGTLAGTGLTQGTTAILLPSVGANLADGGQYTGLRSGAAAFADYVSLIGNTSANWATDLNDGAQFVPFNTTSFQTAATSIPEPASLSLMLLAATMGAVWCRRTGRRRRTA